MLNAFLMICHLVLASILTALVLLQKTNQVKSTGGGFVPRGGPDLTTYITASFAFLFFLNALYLSIRFYNLGFVL